MGRTPTKNLTLPPHMRKRTKASGKTYYYLDACEKPRREIPLGDDFILALRKYAEFYEISKPKTAIVFGDVIKKYETEEIPKKSANTIRVNMSDIKHVKKSFSTAPLDEMTPSHVYTFLQKHKDKPTTANRCKRLLSAMWNMARAWGYTNLANPCEGVRGFSLETRDVYITDAVYAAVKAKASEPLRDALDLAYLTGQRPADALKMTAQNVADGFLEIDQGKTKKKLRISVTGELATLLGKIAVRKAQHKIVHSQLLMNRDGMPLTKAVLRKHFVTARAAAADKHPELADAIKAFWFYDLRAKAADDSADERGEQAASNLLGHDFSLFPPRSRRTFLCEGGIPWRNQP